MLDAAPLFAGIDAPARAGLLAALGARLLKTPRGGDLLRAGESVLGVGLLLAGQAEVYKTDAFGQRLLLTRLEAGDIFGEAFACAGLGELPVSVTALDDCAALFLRLPAGDASDGGEARFLRNLLRLLARRNLGLSRKIDYLSIKSLRRRVAAWLLDEAAARGEPFEAPFDRTGMADYLGCERSALSRELSGMRAQGLVEFRKNRFSLPDRAALQHIAQR